MTTPCTNPGIDAEIESASIDAHVACSTCDAVCCRLTVVLEPHESVPAHLVDRDLNGLRVMARADDGWCRALDRERMRCGIYETRPCVCRKFVMGAAYCRDERTQYAQRKRANAIALRVL